MDTQALLRTHPLHEQYAAHWRFMRAAYQGVDALVREQRIVRHERESERNFRRRLRELYTFNYCRAIVDLFTHYLFRKPAQRDLGALAHDPLWGQFTDDCDLWGANFEVFLLEQQRIAAIMGHAGILVDKYPSQALTRAQEIEQGLYPYCSAYSPLSILDWRYERDQTGRPYLAFLKLLEEQGLYRLWWPQGWETWRLDPGQRPELLYQGDNPLGEIPFVWLYNLRHLEHRGMGQSDLADIAHIDLSILRNLSQTEEVIGLAGFPMMRKPMREFGDMGGDVAGPSAVLEFNPEHGDAGKPDWLEAKVAGTVAAVQEWVAFKVREIYRAANAGGQAMTEMSTQAQSGVALKTKFQLLNSKLAAKATHLAEAERAILWFWLSWQGQSRLYDEVRVERPKTYEVEDLHADLESMIQAAKLITTQSFQRELQKRAARPFIEHLDAPRQNAILRDIEKQEPAGAGIA